MFSPSDFNDAVPQFTNGNYASNPLNPLYIEEPGAIDYNRGVEPLQTLPAQWWNWLANQFTAKFNKLNIYVKNIFDELTMLLSLMGITPDATEGTITTGQLKSAFQTNYPEYVASTSPIKKSENEVFSGGTNGRYVISTTDIECASTENITPLYGIHTIDGVTPVDGNFVLLKDQTDPKENGIYIYNSLGAWNRHSSYSQPSTLLKKVFNVNQGTVNAGKMFYITDVQYEDETTFGTDDINFTEYFGAIAPNDMTIAVRDNSGRLKTADPVGDFDCVNKRSLISASFDIIFPIGMVYTQYPQQKDPNQLWGTYSTWQEITDYAGAFFRATGGNASAFIGEGGTLTKQGNQNQYHSHDMTHGHSVYDPGHSHGSRVYASNFQPQGYGSVGLGSWNRDAYDTYGAVTGNTTGISIYNFTGNTGTNGNSVDTEARPDNFTIKIWKRVS